MIRQIIHAGHHVTGWALRLGISVGLIQPYQPIPDLGISIRPARENGVRKRWAAIRAELPETPSSFLDVGCNVGFYVIESAKLGHFAAGLDAPRHVMALAITRNILGLGNVMPIGMRLDPDNVHSLPGFDVISALQIFHHLCAAYGRDGGVEILETLWEKAGKKFIFETEGGQSTKDSFRAVMPAMDDGPGEWSKRFFEERGASSVRVIYDDESRGRQMICAEK